eukprot:280705-Pelagomonas_calceolata.AAC.1
MCSDGDSAPTKKANPVAREAQTSCTRRPGNECADKNAKYQASLERHNLTDTGIPSAGPDGNPFNNVAWLAREEARPSTPEPSSPIPNLVYFSDPKNALKSQMHAKHRLEYADRKTGYYTYYQSFLLHANKGISKDRRPHWCTDRITSPPRSSD